MKTASPGRVLKLLKVLAVSAVSVLSVYIFSSATSTGQPPRPRPEGEHRLVSPRTYAYVLNQPDACKHRSPFLVLMVPVSPWEAAAREAIRTTWGASGQDTLTLFYMGVPEAWDRGDALEEESGIHADMVQMDFVDSYQNLTIKTMMMMNWLAAHCPQARYAMKVDADNFVNIFHLLKRLRRAPRHSFITGSVISDGRPRRDSSSKWQLSKELYPSDTFPPYVSGAGYVFSMDLATRISWASRFVRMIPMEDVYVGLCLRVLGVRPIYSISLLGLRNLFEVRKLEYDRCTFAQLILANGFEPLQLLHIWQDFSQRHTHCFTHTH